MVTSERSLPLPQKSRTIFLLLLLATGFLLTALILLLYYWDLLVGIYQTVFLVFGFLPSAVAFFAVLCAWVKKNREEAILQIIREEEARKKGTPAS